MFSPYTLISLGLERAIFQATTVKKFLILIAIHQAHEMKDKVYKLANQVSTYSFVQPCMMTWIGTMIYNSHIDESGLTLIYTNVS